MPNCPFFVSLQLLLPIPVILFFISFDLRTSLNSLQIQSKPNRQSDCLPYNSISAGRRVRLSFVVLHHHRTKTIGGRPIWIPLQESANGWESRLSHIPSGYTLQEALDDFFPGRLGRQSSPFSVYCSQRYQGWECSHRRESSLRSDWFRLCFVFWRERDVLLIQRKSNECESWNRQGRIVGSTLVTPRSIRIQIFRSWSGSLVSWSSSLHSNSSRYPVPLGTRRPECKFDLPSPNFWW